MPVELIDLVYLKKAIRRGWDTPPHVREAIVERLLEVLFDPNTRIRMQASILEAFVLMEEINQQEEHQLLEAARRQARKLSSDATRPAAEATENRSQL